ncbi:MAG: HRDC domain-containing protein [Micrococcales bacterium]|nr:HRDC domain-containing protein [Micrococcales bacterium]
MPQVPLHFSDAPEARSGAPATPDPPVTRVAPVSQANGTPIHGEAGRDDSAAQEDSTDGSAAQGAGTEGTHPDGDPTSTAEPTPIPILDRPADGVPDVVADERALVAAAAALAAGTGPVAVDAERASGYRYGQRAYLVQLRREGAGTFLIDPIAVPDLQPLSVALQDAEWIVHAATQDLPCLAEVGLRPSRIFDTELGARLAGLPRVGLSAVLEHYLNVRLAKEHSAADWSTRPLPEPWLRYAALDVELLGSLRDALEADLRGQGKLGWAREEFDHLLGFTGPAPRVDPWRRASGLHKVRGRRSAAVVRELWYARDAVARSRDLSPGRVLPDLGLLDIARAAPTTSAELTQASHHKGAHRHGQAWLDAVARGRAVPDEELPPATLPSDAPPPARAWADRDPAAAARLAQVREAMLAYSQEHTLPVENLLSPDTLRRVLWSPPSDGDVVVALRQRGARPWQVAVVAPLVERALREHPSS